MIVFDAEPLLAYYWNESGSGVVDNYLREIERGDHDGAISSVTCTELHYHVARDDTDLADAFLDRARNWLRVVGADDLWQTAAWYKREHACALGDAYSLATADELDATLLVGADDDFETVESVTVEQFRTDAV